MICSVSRKPPGIIFLADYFKLSSQLNLLHENVQWWMQLRQ
jgi:hypothetical protein